LLREHVREQCITRNIERRTQEHVLAAAIQQAAQLAFVHVELRETMTRRKRHPAATGVIDRRHGLVREIRHVQGGQHQPP